MSRFTLRVLLSSLCAAVLVAPAGAADTGADIQAMWDDPIFQRQFVGTYGANAEIEPRVTPEEVKILEKIRPLMADESKRKEAEAALIKAMKPDCSAVFDFTLGNLRFQRDDMPAALEAYTKAVAKYPSFRRAWRNVGLINARNGEFDKAIEALTKMIKLGGGDEYSYGLLGYAYASKQDFQAAEAAYRNALLLQPDNTEWRLGLTRCVFRQNKFEDAASLLDVLIERTPEKIDYWLLQAQAFIGMKQPLKAAQNLEAVDLQGKSTVDSLHTLGDIYLSEGLNQLAADAYRRAIDRDTAQPAARPVRAAEVLAAKGALREARAIASHTRDALGSAIGDEDRRKLLKLEARLSMAEGDGGAEAVAALEEIIRIDPLDGDALILLGQHYAKDNQPDKAIFYYERAEGIEAFEANARIRHAQVLITMSRYDESLKLLRRAQEIKPREDIARYIEQVERIAKSKR
jgi:tetratricopeptide (TPR) repeat protein